MAPRGSAKVDAQFMALASSTYFTSRTLAGVGVSGDHLQVTDTGIGTNVVNVGNRGAAFGVADGTSLTVMQLLLATDAQTDPLSGFASIHDRNGDGVIDRDEAKLRILAKKVFASI